MSLTVAFKEILIGARFMSFHVVNNVILCYAKCNACTIAIDLTKERCEKNLASVSFWKHKYIPVLILDPYITIKLLYNDKLVVKKKTKAKKGTSSPCWNEPFAFDLDENDLNNYMLVFTIKGKDIFSSPTKIGVVYVGVRAESTGRQHWIDSVCCKNNMMRQVTMTHKLSWLDDMEKVREIIHTQILEA